MNKRGAALIFAFLVVTVLTILSVGLLIRSASENRLAIRQVGSMSAFWVAEAGVSRALSGLPATGTLSNMIVQDPNVIYTVSTAEITPAGNPYRIFSINSTGRVLNTDVRRGILATARYTPPTPDFDAALELAKDLETKGSVSISGEPELEPCKSGDPCDNETKYAIKNSTFTFEAKFSLSPQVVKAYAMSQGTYYEVPGGLPNKLPNWGSGVYWIKVAPGDEFEMTESNWIADHAIIIVEGNCKLNGGDIDGILWVMGELNCINGNPDVNGAIVCESNATLTTIGGTGDYYWDPDVINETFNASGVGDLGSRQVVSWREF